MTDDDRVALNSMKYGSRESAGSSSTYLTTIQNLPPWAIRSGARGPALSLVARSHVNLSVLTGAREQIYFDPTQVTAAIVTCGGLCPGLNDVVAGLVNKLESYGVQQGKILGIKYGFRGFYDPDEGKKPVVLTKKSVDGIQLQGGTILGTSRGGADIKEIVKRIDMWGIDMLFVVGGNGGNAGANAINERCRQHEVNCCVIGIVGDTFRPNHTSSSHDIRIDPDSLVPPCSAAQVY